MRIGCSVLYYFVTVSTYFEINWSKNFNKTLNENGIPNFNASCIDGYILVDFRIYHLTFIY